MGVSTLVVVLTDGEKTPRALSTTGFDEMFVAVDDDDDDDEAEEVEEGVG